MKISLLTLVEGEGFISDGSPNCEYGASYRFVPLTVSTIFFTDARYSCGPRIKISLWLAPGIFNNFLSPDGQASCRVWPSEYGMI